MTTTDDRLQRMCVREVCERRGWLTYERKCPACGFRTWKWNAYQAERLNPRSAAAKPPPPSPVLIVTTNDVPGYRVTKVHGDVFGLTVRARNVFSNFGASLRTVVGGEVAGYTKLLTASRHEARGRLIDAAREFGANAVVAMRFDCNEIGDIMTEIAAYVTVVEESDEARVGPPSGWYEQSLGSGDFVWWDGSQWVEDGERQEGAEDGVPV